jgi:hypothetical protein
VEERNVRRRAVTVRVLVHLTSDGQSAVGVVASEWQGAVKVSRRLARLRPAREPEWFPPGVDRDVYRAYMALGDLVVEQRTDLLLGQEPE